ncbi:hypothetical protein [Ammoniphilus sp. 3BR4]|uniref:hypothetical protein n=1 Tax=Ammoniphilus sp. 3BR4 TaxID=3158265 RepID=UPI003466EAE2
MAWTIGSTQPKSMNRSGSEGSRLIHKRHCHLCYILIRMRRGDLIRELIGQNGRFAYPFEFSAKESIPCNAYVVVIENIPH